jgi:cardiolipin synthase A/B
MQDEISTHIPRGSAPFTRRHFPKANHPSLRKVTPFLRCSLAILALATSLLAACQSSAFQRVPHTPPPVRSPEFAAELATTALAPLTHGNSARTLANGDAFFPAMLDAAASAKKSITFECYTARDCQPVADFSAILARKARAGVKVHVILDSFGCWPWGDHHIAAMRAAGVQLHEYSPFNFFLPLKYNHRTHRRILVVDGRTGFCGGAGWAYNWTGDAQSSNFWRDTQYQLRGPVVAQLQRQFTENWAEITGTNLTGPDYFPPLPPAGPLTAQMVSGSPLEQRDTIGSSNLLAIRAARKSIQIQHSYFLPTSELRDALIAAAKRGVAVEIIIPGAITDMPFAKEVMQGTLRRMMNAGIKLYEFAPTMLHAKLVIVDDHLVIAGSGNLDQRSFFINDENNLHVLNSPFAAEQRRMFEKDKARSVPLTEATLRLPLWRKARGIIGLATLPVL